MRKAIIVCSLLLVLAVIANAKLLAKPLKIHRKLQVPTTAAPVTPAPVIAAPVTPAPVTPAPVTPAPVTPAPVAPVAVTPATAPAIAPATAAPTTPAKPIAAGTPATAPPPPGKAAGPAPIKKTKSNKVSRLIAGSIWITVGLILAFMLLKFFGFQIYLIAFFFAFQVMITASYIMYGFPEEGKQSQFDIGLMIFLSCATIAGIAIVVLLCMKKQLWHHVTGIMIGFSIGNRIMLFVVNMCASEPGRYWAIIMFAVACGFAGVGWFAAKKWVDHYIIICGAIYGGLAVGQGALLLWGKIHDKSGSGKLIEYLNVWQIIVYALIIVIVAASGMFVQQKMWNKAERSYGVAVHYVTGHEEKSTGVDTEVDVEVDLEVEKKSRRSSEDLEAELNIELDDELESGI